MSLERRGHGGGEEEPEEEGFCILATKVLVHSDNETVHRTLRSSWISVLSWVGFHAFTG